MERSLAILIMVLMIAACAIRQTVSPVAQIEGKQVCIIENPMVREGFLAAFKQALEDKGYEGRVLEPSSSVDACPITATYTANWRWDMTTYMAYAAIRVYHNGKTAGEAIYDTGEGSESLGKFINARKKVRELVNQLFPDRTGS